MRVLKRRTPALAIRVISKAEVGFADEPSKVLEWIGSVINGTTGWIVIEPDFTWKVYNDTAFYAEFDGVEVK